jgi:hypothetical protein
MVGWGRDGLRARQAKQIGAADTGSPSGAPTPREAWRLVPLEWVVQAIIDDAGPVSDPEGSCPGRFR